MIERNVLLRFKRFERDGASKGRRVNRGAFTEDEAQRLLGAARPDELS